MGTLAYFYTDWIRPSLGDAALDTLAVSRLSAIAPAASTFLAFIRTNF